MQESGSGAVEGDEAYIRYHDEHWGVPVHDDTTHFTMLTLEAAQAGLSWKTMFFVDHQWCLQI